MRLSKSFFVTRREETKEDYITNLLIKSGLIYKYDNSTFFYLPLGLKVLENIKNVIRQEHNKYNLEETLMPSLINEKIFMKNNKLYKDSFKFISKEGNHLCMCPTHEELFAVLGSIKIKSYKDLHFTLYQISNKYRDENKLSFARKEEFLMCDSYSFDSSNDGLDISYDNMYHIYNNIFKRLNVDYMVCESDPNAMGGKYSEEFHYVYDSGEDEIVKCEKCTYAANKYVAECSFRKEKKDYHLKMKKVYTPNVKSIDEVSKYLNTKKENIIKSLIYKIDKKFVLVLVRGIDEVNEIKLSKYFKTNNVRLASEEEVSNLGGEIGYVGPINTRLLVVADNNIKNVCNGICGSNDKNYHYINVNADDDFKVSKYIDLRIFNDSDKCPICDSKCKIHNTIEIANLFKLGTRYSDEFKLKFSDEENKYNRVYMGSYGIGVERLMLACACNNKDENGLVWPMDIAPYKVAIIVVNINDRDAYRYASELYDKLMNLNIETVFDDRKVSAGVKFKDIDLIGVPIQIIVGYKNSENIVELKLRSFSIKKEIKKAEVIETIKELL